MEDFVFIKSGYDYIKIFLGEVIYVESARNYVRFVTHKQHYLFRYSMGDAENILRCYGFCRIHKRYIISLQYITGFDQNIVNIGTNKFPIGRIYKEGFKQKLASIDNKSRKPPTHFDGDVDKLLNNIHPET